MTKIVQIYDQIENQDYDYNKVRTNIRSKKDRQES